MTGIVNRQKKKSVRPVGVLRQKLLPVRRNADEPDCDGSMLQPYEGVIAAQTGHVSSHEAGAIESSGHKVLTLPQHDGKIEPEELGRLSE